MLPPDAVDPRISGAYGSGHHGSWQFTAYLTWRTPSGQVRGGRVDLPAGGASAPWDLPSVDDKLRLEHDIGWTLPRIERDARQLTDPAAPLALLELEIPSSGVATLTTCSARTTTGEGRCTQQTDGTAPSTFTSQLLDEPSLGALAVHLSPIHRRHSPPRHR